MRMAAVATAAVGAYVLGWLSRQPQVDAARREASTDSLTGLANRSELKRQLRIRAQRGQPYTIYMLDLNGFKPVNDTWGHRAGDELLRQLGTRLVDHFAGQHLVARVGGDEFVLVIDMLQTRPAAGALAARVMSVVAQPVRVPGSPEPVTLTTAIGIARAEAGADPRGALHAADLAMYRSKTLGAPHQITVGTRRIMNESPLVRVRDARPVRVAQSL